MRRLTTTARVLLATAVLTSSAIVAAPPSRAIVDGVFAGACHFLGTVNVQYTGPLTLVPGARTIALSGSGSCVVNGVPGTMDFIGGLNSAAFSCEGGVALGAASFSIRAGNFSTTFNAATIALVNTGSAMNLVASWGVYGFAADGEFVQNPLQAASCASGLSQTTWTGTLVWEDPTLPVG